MAENARIRKELVLWRLSLLLVFFLFLVNLGFYVESCPVYHKIHCHELVESCPIYHKIHCHELITIIICFTIHGINSMPESIFSLHIEPSHLYIGIELRPSGIILKHWKNYLDRMNYRIMHQMVFLSLSFDKSISKFCRFDVCG